MGLPQGNQGGVCFNGLVSGKKKDLTKMVMMKMIIQPTSITHYLVSMDPFQGTQEWLRKPIYIGLSFRSSPSSIRTNSTYPLLIADIAIENGKL